MLDRVAPQMAAHPVDLPAPKRVDLHAHTLASAVAGEAALKAIDCPECFSNPAEVARQARLRGMDFVCITDHDTISGATSLSHDPLVIVGEEVTTRFPEDGCCFHLLVYGIDQRQHEMLQSRRDDVRWRTRCTGRMTG
jgi:predicted metal-dependent phosphoesterase TrpH